MRFRAAGDEENTKVSKEAGQKIKSDLPTPKEKRWGQWPGEKGIRPLEIVQRSAEK